MPPVSPLTDHDDEPSTVCLTGAAYTQKQENIPPLLAVAGSAVLCQKRLLLLKADFLRSRFPAFSFFSPSPALTLFPVAVGPDADAAERPAHSGDGGGGQGHAKEIRQISEEADNHVPSEGPRQKVTERLYWSRTKKYKMKA